MLRPNLYRRIFASLIINQRLNDSFRYLALHSHFCCDVDADLLVGERSAIGTLSKAGVTINSRCAPRVR